MTIPVPVIHISIFVVFNDIVGTSMEGNFLGGTKNTKKVVHFECGSTQGKWFGGKAHRAVRRDATR